MQDYEISDRLSDVQYLSILDNNYPKSLLDELGINSPTVLSYRGNVALLSKNKVGFSGSRKVSDKGLGIATDIATQLSGQGFCLVSGYANGVDMIAHKTALANGLHNHFSIAGRHKLFLCKERNCSLLGLEQSVSCK